MRDLGFGTEKALQASPHLTAEVGQPRVDEGELRGMPVEETLAQKGGPRNLASTTT